MLCPTLVLSPALSLWSCFHSCLKCVTSETKTHGYFKLLLIVLLVMIFQRVPILLCYVICILFLFKNPQWAAADAEMKVPSGKNTELIHSPFQAWSRSVYSNTCYPYCQEFLSYLFLPFRSNHLHFFSKTSPNLFLCWLWLTLVPV